MEIRSNELLGDVVATNPESALLFEFWNVDLTRDRSRSVGEVCAEIGITVRELAGEIAHVRMIQMRRNSTAGEVRRCDCTESAR